MEEYRKTHERLVRVFEKEIVFIIGATRWGTAWMQQCLDAHPEICCKGEGHFTDSLFPLLAGAFDRYNARSEVVGNRLQKSGLAGNAAGFTVDDVDHLMTTAIGLMLGRWAGDGVGDGVGTGAGVKVIAEKTPEHIVSLDRLAGVVPSMKVIHVYRDGRDEAVAVWDFNRGLSQGAFQEKFPRFGDFAEAFANNWMQGISATRRFEREHRGRCFHVRAEDFQGVPGPALRPLLKFLGVDDGETVIKDCADAAWEAVPLDVDPGAWKKKFDDKSTQFYKRQCGELLKLLGYEV